MVNSDDPMLLGWLMRFFYAIFSTKADFKLQVFVPAKSSKRQKPIQLLENAFYWLETQTELKNERFYAYSVECSKQKRCDSFS